MSAHHLFGPLPKLGDRVRVRDYFVGKRLVVPAFVGRIAFVDPRGLYFHVRDEASGKEWHRSRLEFELISESRGRG